MKKTLVTIGMMFASTSAIAETVQDFNKTVVNRVPYNVEVCENRTVGGGNAGEGAFLGMLLGGVSGKVIGGNDKGAAAGAILGGIIGADNAGNKKGQVQRVCHIQTRYEEEVVEVYSHSVVTFYHSGRQYQLQFNK